jgi:hypothetical protein
MASQRRPLVAQFRPLAPQFRPLAAQFRPLAPPGRPPAPLFRPMAPPDRNGEASACGRRDRLTRSLTYQTLTSGHSGHSAKRRPRSVSTPTTANNHEHS